MALSNPTAGLRRLFYDSVSVAKVEVHVQPGDELAVSEDVAAQLQAADSHFKDAVAPKAAPAADEVAEDEPASEPVKSTVKKAAARKG